MATPQKLGFDDVSKQDLFAIYSETPDDLPNTFGLSSPRFICFLAWDSQGVDADKITEVAMKILNAGAVCACGLGCHRVHDIVDQVALGANPSEPIDRVIMIICMPTILWPKQFGLYSDACFRTKIIKRAAIQPSQF
jgi:hypothetical protein